MEQESGISYKKIVSGVVLLLLLGSLPFIYYLVTQTQVFKPKASTYDIDIVPKTGVSVIQENGVPVIQTTLPDEFKIKITSPLDSQPGADAGFSIVKPTYASDNVTGDRCGVIQPTGAVSRQVYKNGNNVGACGYGIGQRCGEIPLLGGSMLATCFDRWFGLDGGKVIGKVCTTDGEVTTVKQNGDMSIRSGCFTGEVCQTLLDQNLFTVEGKNLSYRFDAKCVASSTANTGAQPSQDVPSTGSRGCYEETQVCDNNQGSHVCRVCDGGYDSGCATPCIVSAVPSAPADAPGGTSPSVSRGQSASPQVCGKQCIYSQGDTCYSGNCKELSQNCGFNDNCGFVEGCSSGVVSACPTSGGGQSGGSNAGTAAAPVAVDEFADHSLDGKRSAYTCAEGPLDAEKPAGQYKWVADCSRKCLDNDERDPEDPAGCPKNTTDLYVNPSTSKWCYGFKDGNRCMQLKWTGAPALRTPAAPTTSTTTTQTPATPTPATPGTPAAPATPAQPANPAPAAPAPAAPPAQPNNAANNTTNTAGRRTTHYRVTTDPSRPGTWAVYTSGGVNLPYSFASFQPGKKVFLYVQFKDDVGSEFNARPYPIEIRYVATTATAPPPAQNTASCTKGKVCGGSDTPCGAGGAGKCDACSGGWCKGGACETCAADDAISGTVPPACRTTTVCGQSVTGDKCTQACDGTRAKYDCQQNDNPNCRGSVYCSTDDNKCGAVANTNPTCGTTCGGCSLKDTCGNRTYDTCDTAPCSAAGATASTTFKCYAKDSPNNCVGEYLCGSVCAGSAAAPATTRTTTTPTTGTSTGTSTPSYEPE